MSTAQPFNVRTSAAQAIAGLRRARDVVFLGRRAEAEERFALAVNDGDQAAADRAISDFEADLEAEKARIAAERTAFNCAPSFRRRTEAGHDYLLVNRKGGMRFVPLCELTDAELAYFADTAAKIAALPKAATEPTLPRGARLV